MKMQYRVTFKSMFGVALVLSLIAFFLILGGILYQKLFLVIFGIIFVALVFAIRSRLKIIVDNNQIVYTGLFTTKIITFVDIIHTGWLFEHGHSRDRFYGSFIYEILSQRDSIRINFRLFSLDSMKIVIDMLENLPAKPSAHNL